MSVPPLPPVPLLPLCTAVLHAASMSPKAKIFQSLIVFLRAYVAARGAIVHDGSPDPQTTGAAVMENGVQVLKVGLASGYYEPNNFTVQAGVPVTVVFTGNAEGCLAEPELPELGLKADMSGGSATLVLGQLKPGKYSFTCSMGVNEGTITVR